MTGKQFGTVLAVVVLVLACGGIYTVVHPDRARGGQSPAQTISVVGTGTVTTTPDRARFSFSAHATRDTAKAAVAANAVKMQRIVDALKGAGVASRDIQTEQVYVSTAYNNGTITGYTASNEVSVNVLDIDRSGAIIDLAVDAGATAVYGPSLLRSDRAQLSRTALKAAVNDARARATAVAAASGAVVGRVVTVTEAGAVPAAPVLSGGTTGGTSGIATLPATPTPVQAGEQTIDATVSVTFVAQ